MAGRADVGGMMGEGEHRTVLAIHIHLNFGA